MISVSNLEKAYGDRVLFTGASFQLNPGERYGLVGANGSGKTTLLNILAGDLDPTDGRVSMPKHLRLGVLRQDQFLFEEESIIQVALMGNAELWEAMREKEELLARAREDESSFDAERFGELEETVQRFDGYAAEARAGTILEGLGIPAEVHHDPISTLSGGFKLRVLLAQVLAAKPDVLFLDEPTNHLDILSIAWLEGFLREFEGPAVVISHDHRFLDSVSTHILDVDYQTVTLYHGNYTHFLQAKEEERERREKEIEAREREIAHHQKFVDRFRAKASKARQAQSKLKLIEKAAEDIQELPPSSRRYPTFRFEQRRHSGKEVLEVRGVTKAFDENEVLHGVDLRVARGDRLAIIGPNGIGKSTLLKILVGDLEADAGTVEWGYETHPGYFAQDHRQEFEDQERTAEEWVWDFAPGKDIGWIRGRMALMLFTGDDSKKRLSSLSGGEAARLVFTRLSLEQPNVLVLDEPTNHLDLESIEALVEGLKEFDGTLILVSHDRWFVGELATRVVEISRDGIVDYPGTYDEFVAAHGDDHLDADEVLLKAREEEREARREKKLSPKERRKRRARERAREDHPARIRKRLGERSEEILSRVAEAEDRVEEIEARFAEPGFFDDADPDELRGLQEERAALRDRRTDGGVGGDRSGGGRAGVAVRRYARGFRGGSARVYFRVPFPLVSSTASAMRICLLTDQELDADPFDPDDWPCDPRPFIPEADWTLVTLEPSTAVNTVQTLAREDFDVFFNLCDGAWDEGRVGVEVVITLERLGVPFTGADAAFFEPSREVMKRVCHARAIPTPGYRFVTDERGIEEAGRALRFPLFVKHPSSYASNGLTRKSRVADLDELREQARLNIDRFGSALVEEFIEGTEATVLVAENPDDPKNPVTFQPLIYDFPEGETFKHYELKWVDYDGMSANPVADAALDSRLREVSAEFFLGMRGAGFGRCDIRVATDGTPYMLEINPNCGVFYPPTDPGSADLCLLAEEKGHERFARMLVDAALARHRRRISPWSVRTRPTGGYGLFADRSIGVGETIIRFEEAPHTLVTRRHVEENWSERERTWFDAYAWPLTDEVWVTWDEDPEEWKPVSHSCDPNAWLSGLDVVARRPIAVGEEVTLDYATFYNENMTSFDCSCGSPECRGVIRGTDLLEPFVERYGDHVSDYVCRRRAAHGAVRAGDDR